MHRNINNNNNNHFFLALGIGDPLSTKKITMILIIIMIIIVSLRVYCRGETDYFFTLRTIALHYSLAYYLSYFPYWPSDYYLSKTYVLATVITQNGCTDI